MPRDSKKKKRRSPASELSDDILVEIISRVPYKSARCCKCVCRRWRDLVSHPDHRKKLPLPPLAGFFYRNNARCGEESRCYKSLTGPPMDPSLSFLPAIYDGVELLDCCNGLLLCRRKKKIPDYIVCNPASQTWAAVRATEWPHATPHVRLSFDPAVSSSGFHVFEFIHEFTGESHKGCPSMRVESVTIYSSKSRVSTHRSIACLSIDLCRISRSAFLDDVLYLPSYLDSVLAAIDVEGNCNVIRYPSPRIASADVYISQGQLYLASYGRFELSFWALEDSSSETWILKHKVSHLQLFGEKYPTCTPHLTVITGPEHNAIFIVCTKTFYYRPSVSKLLSYNVDSRELHSVCDLPRGCTSPYLPYVPLLSVEPLAGGQ